VLRRPSQVESIVGLATTASVAFLAVGATFAVTDRLGARPFDFPALIILLTAVHFHFAGFVLPLAAALAYRRAPGRRMAVAIGLVLTGIPVTAIGFFGFPVVNWVGSMLTATGALGIGVGTLSIAGELRPKAAVAFGTIAGLSLRISMPMAAIYSTQILVGANWVDVATMARIHGTLNALGFALPVVLAWSLDRRSRRRATGPADALDVMAFNVWPFIAGPTIAIMAGVVALAAPWPVPVRLVIAFGAVAAATLSIAAMTAVVWVFAIDAGRRWRWIARAAASPQRWLNVTTGFDDTTSKLDSLLPAADGHAIDTFDPAIHHEAAQRRARRRFPPAGASVLPSTIGTSLGGSPYEAVFLLMAVHETHGEDRRRLFDAVAGSLTPDGRLIVVEHLRDAANAIAFGPGSRHFQTRAVWLKAAMNAGLILVDEARLAPFVRGLAFARSRQ
jgi:hypothetical protein